MADTPLTDGDDSYSSWEKPLFEMWRDSGAFERSAGFGKYGNASYTITIPPPNITGVLHMGHALNDTIQDACIRHARMQGYQTRWILGTDHAGIATQTKVDKHLAEQGINRREIGREKFIEACYQWREKYGNYIVSQIEEMGCSCDYDDEQFTMSPEFSRAVRRVFTDWYHDDLIYRGKRIVNWCPGCTTAIADDEAEYVNEKGSLWHLRYPLVEPIDGQDYIVVATTRPETMLGDTGVAVSPKDPEKKKFVGAKVMLPIVDREIPIFSDFYVDAEFGSGFVKVTPAHDPNDWGMGQRHDLEQINIFDETAHVIEGYGKYSGMTRDEAREAIVADFEELGLLDHIDEHDHSVMTCYRCHEKLEPWLSEQWFVAVDELKKKAAAVVENDTVSFYPARWKQVYLDWMENLKDWCISRQLWWGHRIPMYYCDTCGWEDASVDDLDVCPQCGAPLRQDEDVLDTWFSSQLWPFATQGWGSLGADSPQLKEHYPTQVLSTARDIMGLWVARMVMASEYCLDEIPFEDVIIHPTVMGSDGKPMSKSRGNGVDPIELMKNYGADGMRFGLLMQVTGAQAMKFNESKLESSRNFANKVRNAARFVMMHLEDFEPGAPEPVSPADKWIFSRLARLVRRLDTAYDSYEFGEITRELYSFVWNEFCDWYIELSKSRLQSDDVADKRVCQRNLVFVLDNVLRLLHPIMPFVTESIFQDLPTHVEGELLITSAWPDADDLSRFVDDVAERSLVMVTETVSGIRSVRARYGISPKKALNVTVVAEQADVVLLEEQAGLFADIANLDSLTIAVDAEKPAESSLVIAEGVKAYVELSGLVDFDAERKRLEKNAAALRKDFEKFDKKLSNPGFLKNAQPEIIEKDTAKRNELHEKLQAIESQLEELA